MICEAKEADGGESDRVMPFPNSLATWGLSEALSVMAIDPYSCPSSVGVKVTLMEHVPPGPTLLPHVLVWANVPEVTAMLVMVTVDALVLVSVTICAALVVPSPCEEKKSGEGFNKITAPVPWSVAVWGLSTALSVTVRVPVRKPAAVGVKIMPMVQLKLTGTLVPQVVEVGWTAKSPLATIPEMLRVVPVSLNNVMPRAALVEPKLCVGKVRTAGDRTTVVPRPER